MRSTLAQVARDVGGRIERGAPDTPVAGVSTDSRTLAAGALFAALRGPTFDGHAFLAAAAGRGACAALVAIDAPLPAGDFAIVRAPGDTLRALGDLAHAHRMRMGARVVAITGSAGKTTTKEMIAAVLSEEGPTLATQGNLNNWVGVPLTLFGLEPSHRFAVVEMGMNAFGEIARLAEIAAPHVGLITLVGAGHTEGLGGVEAVLRAKAELFEALGPDAFAIVNLDDARIVSLRSTLRARVVTFGAAPGADVRIVAAPELSLDGTRFTVEVRGARVAVTLPLLGAHQAHNAAGAMAATLALGVSPATMVRGLARTRTVAGRMCLRRARGLTVIDDSYNANPQSMVAALDTLATLAEKSGTRAVAVLGDMRELGAESHAQHIAIGRHASARAKVLYTLGAESLATARAASAAGLASVEHSNEPDALRNLLREGVRDGDLVLVKGSRGMRMERFVAALIGGEAGGAH